MHQHADSQIPGRVCLHLPDARGRFGNPGAPFPICIWTGVLYAGMRKYITWHYANSFLSDSYKPVPKPFANGSHVHTGLNNNFWFSPKLGKGWNQVIPRTKFWFETFVLGNDMLCKICKYAKEYAHLNKPMQYQTHRRL